MKIQPLVIILTSIFLALTLSLNAGYLHRDLSDKIAANPDQFYSAYVVMNDNSNGMRLSSALGLDLYTRQAGHALAVKHLKDKANASQHELLRYLEAQSAVGNVRSFKGRWIANVISVAATGSLLDRISKRDDVKAIYEIVSAPLIEPVESVVADVSSPEVLPSALTVIGADSMWTLGYTGAGRLVCSFDTGIYGAHPALRDSWHGNNGYSWQESWFDPVDGDSFPHTYPASSNIEHGTHTMGIMVAHDDSQGDTVGVAPNAQWISAAVIDLGVAVDILEAFEWAADPDGNPNTVTDVPDVVSNSWGFHQSDLGCDDLFWTAIDNLEDLGAVCVFACGNEGMSGSQTIRNPANRASSSYNSFAVGMINSDESGFPVDPRSSQGPSDCDGVSLKPQVVAPGVNIRSTYPNNSYGIMTGTSMACPYVAGAVALLREYNPNAPVDSIKKALMQSAIDVEDPGLDYKSGYGLIYIPAALDLLAPNNAPNIYISAITQNQIWPGDTLEIILSLANSGLGLSDVEATLRSDSPDAVVTDSSYIFGNIPMNGEADNNGSPFVITFDVSIVSGEDRSFVLHVTGSGDYSKGIPLIFTVGQRPDRQTFVHNVGNVVFSMSNYGQDGFAAASITDLGLPGFVWPKTGNNYLFEMGLLVASDAGHVSDAVRNTFYLPDNDFEVSPGGSLILMEPGIKTDQESRCSFDDSRAEHPIGVEILQETYAFADPPDDDYVIVDYHISNTTSQFIDNLVVGIFSDWDWPWESGNNDRVGFCDTADLGYMYNSTGSDYRGIAVLNSEGATAFRAIKRKTYLDDGDGFSTADKWEFMTGGIVDSSSYLSDPDHSNLIATGPFSVSPDDTIEVAFAVIGASSLDDLISSAQRAKNVYDNTITSAEEHSDNDRLPYAFELHQNYPNPFNPTTTIEFHLDRNQRVSVTVYNLLGQKVVTLLDKSLNTGTHEVIWDATGHASGVYFYRLKTESVSKVKKMVLLK